MSVMIIKVHRKRFFIACTSLSNTIQNIHTNETESRLDTQKHRVRIDHHTLNMRYHIVMNYPIKIVAQICLSIVNGWPLKT